MPVPIVFFDISGPNVEELQRFYAQVFEWPCESGGTFVPGNAANLDGFLREDPADKVIYLGVPDVTTTLAAVERAGGTIEVPRFETPGVAVIGLFLDPAGNRMGLVEMNGDTPVIP
ncbi:MAG: hypothetical protein AAFZ74_04500 [Pseudomonadota bacterium]